MFRIEIDPESKEHVFVAPDGESLPLRDDVWERLRDPEAVFADWKKFLQKWSIHVEKAPLLKRECPEDAEYRRLRTLVRTFAEPGA
jgi:hypothetical protein